MGDIRHGIKALLFRQRTGRPVGVTRGFVQLHIGDRADKVVVGDTVAEAANACGDLGIKDIGRHLTAELDENLDVLPRSMEDLDHLGIGQQIEKARKIEIWRQRIDQHGLVIGRRLDQAQFGPVSGFAQELCIHRHKVELGGTLAKSREHFCGNYEVHAGSRLIMVNIVPSRCRTSTPYRIYKAIRAGQGAKERLPART